MVGPMVDYFINHQLTMPFLVNLGQYIFSNYIGGYNLDRAINKLNFVKTSVSNGVIRCDTKWFTININSSTFWNLVASIRHITVGGHSSERRWRQ